MNPDTLIMALCVISLAAGWFLYLVKTTGRIERLVRRLADKEREADHWKALAELEAEEKHRALRFIAAQASAGVGPEGER